MKPTTIVLSTLVAAAFLAVGCKSVQGNQNDLHSTQERNVTVGIVQKEIRKGMSGAEVAEALGSPNIVTKDENENETWVYDKIATEASYSSSQNSLFLILGGFSNQSGAASTTQRTLTVVIKYDDKGRVASYSYRQSKF